MSKIVSVIVPVYNVEDYVERCVNSISSQSYKLLDIILIDDGSTDSSGIICDKLAQRDNRIRIVHKQNEGLGYARNSGLDIAKGQYIFFVDSDDYIMPDIIAILVDSIMKYKADIACCGYRSGKKEYYVHRKPQIFTGLEATGRMFIKSGIDANAVCKLYRREFFSAIRYPQGVYESVPITYKILLASSKIIDTGVVGYYIEKRENSITRAAFGQNNIVNINLTYTVYQEINQTHKELANKAYAFYLDAIVSAMESAQESVADIQMKEYQETLRLFKLEYHNIIFRSRISKRKKLIAVLIHYKLYRILRKIYRYIRG